MLKRIFAVGCAALAAMAFATGSFAAEVDLSPGFDLAPSFTLDLASVDPAFVAAPEVVAMVEPVQVFVASAGQTPLSAGRAVAALPVGITGGDRIAPNIAFHLLI